MQYKCVDGQNFLRVDFVEDNKGLSNSWAVLPKKCKVEVEDPDSYGMV